jgi:hypothetical protein
LRVSSHAKYNFARKRVSKFNFDTRERRIER